LRIIDNTIQGFQYVVGRFTWHDSAVDGRTGSLRQCIFCVTGLQHRRDRSRVQQGIVRWQGLQTLQSMLVRRHCQNAFHVSRRLACFNIGHFFKISAGDFA
jgi:hypothetical protein